MGFMSRAWQKFDFKGGGLQTANLLLARALKKRYFAYILWVLFPVGAHAAYLRAPRRMLAYWLLTLLAVAAWLWLPRHWFWIPIGVEAVFALSDLRWIDRRLVGLNKEIRMAIYLRQTQGAPQGFKGHYTDEDGLADYTRLKEQERAGHSATPGEPGNNAPRRRLSSFAQQEALLRELAKKKPERK